MNGKVLLSEIDIIMEELKNITIGGIDCITNIDMDKYILLFIFPGKSSPENFKEKLNDNCTFDSMIVYNTDEGLCYSIDIENKTEALRFLLSMKDI